MTAPALDPRPETSPGRPARRRWLGIALAVSVALNLLVVGLVVGAVIGAGGPPGARDGGRGPGVLQPLGPIALGLDREDRAAVRQRLFADRARFHAEAQGLAESFSAFVAALRVPEFDRAAAEAALAAQRARGGNMQASGHAVLLDHIETMSPEARATLAARIEARVARSLPRGRRTPDS